MPHTKYPIEWSKDEFYIKIFCSIPNVATGILLRAGKNHFIIDPGDGILRDLINELPTDYILTINDVFITHGHHDHVGGVWSFLTYLRVMQKKDTLNLYYPKGCVEIESIYNAFINVYGNSLTYKIKLNKITDQPKIKAGNITVEPFPVIHKEPVKDKSVRQVPALGYKFIFQKMKICYGGDTAYCDTLVKKAKGSDLAIIEAGHEGDEPDEMHMSVEEARSIGESAKEYVLVHVPI